MTLATITFQNYFRLYDKLSGMTGTAMTEQEEFYKIYGLEVVAIPTHRPMIRDDDADLVFRNENAKFNALIDEVVEMSETGPAGARGHDQRREERGALRDARPARRQARGAQRQVPREGSAHRRPGRAQLGAVTIATNMAGRGTDIKLGGDPAGPRLGRPAPAAASTRPRRRPSSLRRGAREGQGARSTPTTSEVVAAGGLHIIGTERHDARRIDNQLRGRAGRQGDPGSSRFYLSLEDTLMKRFASDRVAGLMERMGLEGDVAIESRLVCKTIENAQSRVEGYNFDIRKRVVEYDDVINKQRETIYAERDKVLRNEDLTATVRDFVDDEIERAGRGAPRRRARRRLGLRRAGARRWQRSGLQGRDVDGPTASKRSACARTSSRRCTTRVDKALEEREKQHTARRSGRRSSGSSCCARSTRCGSTT